MQGGTMRPTFLSSSSSLLHGWQSVVFILTLGASLSACSSITWKEEVLLHDGKKIIVTRTNTYDPKGLRELGQPDPLKESTLTFTVPGTKQTVMWRSDYGRGYQDNLDLLMLDFLNGVPYIATTTGFCHAYNKWGRPNPPYVFFKYDGEWKRIPLTEFPADFKQANVVISAYKDKKIKEVESSMGFVPASELNKLNKYSQKRYSTIIRTPLTSGPENIAAVCMKEIYTGNGWMSLDYIKILLRGMHESLHVK
jgi:hypothetical protein